MLRNALAVAAVAALAATAWYNRAAVRGMQTAHERMAEWRYADLELREADWARHTEHAQRMIDVAAARNLQLQRDMIDYQAELQARTWQQMVGAEAAGLPDPVQFADQVPPGEPG